MLRLIGLIVWSLEQAVAFLVGEDVADIAMVCQPIMEPCRSTVDRDYWLNDRGHEVIHDRPPNNRELVASHVQR